MLVEDNFFDKEASMQLDIGGAEQQALHEIVDFSGKRILEVGGGGGWRTYMYKQPDNEVTSIDLNKRSVDLARTRVKDVQLIQGNLFSLVFDGLFDLVVFSRSLHHFPGEKPGKARALNRGKRLLNPGGQILVVEPGLESPLSSVADLFRAERQSIAESLLAIIEYDWKIVDQRAAVVQMQFDNFEEFFQFFFSVECSEPYPGIVARVKGYLQIKDPFAPIHFKDTTNIILLK